MAQLHCPHVAPAGANAPTDDDVVTVPAWWCLTCGRTEADEHTRPCPDCLFTQTGDHVRVAAAGGGPVAARLDRGLAELERAQRLVGDAEMRMERLLDHADARAHAVLGGAAEVLHEIGAVLLGMHSALTVASLVAEGRR